MLLSLLPADSPLYNIQNPRARRIVLIAFVFGFFLAYNAFVVGAIFCLEGTRALIQFCMYRTAWLAFLQQDVPRLFRKTTMRNGDSPSVEYEMHRNRLTGEIDQCSVSLEYRITLRSGHDGITSSRLVKRTIDSQENTEYSLETVLYLLQQVQEEEEMRKDNGDNDNNSSLLSQFLYMPTHPDQGLPLYFVENKRQEQIFWARYVDIGMAFFGVHIYFLASFIHANLTAESSSEVWWYMTLAVLSPLLMAPYLIAHSKAQHQRRMQAWQQDPLLVSTEFETLWKYWQWMGSTIRRKIYTFLFLSAIVILFLFCGFISVLLALTMIYSIVGWVDADAPIQRETLQAFQRRATTLSATVVEHWWEPARSILGMRKHFVRIQYVAPSGESVVKEIQSKLLYEDLGQNGKGESSSPIEILIDSEYPLSGYPTLQFIWDLHHAWSLCTWHVVCFGTMWFYLCTAAMALDVDLDDPPEESAVSFAVIFITPMLLLPHASLLRRKAFDQYLLNLYERGRIVESPLGKNGEESRRQDAVRIDKVYRAEDCDSESSSNGSGSDSYESYENDW